MTVVNILDTLTAWAQERICSQVRLKVPPDNEIEPDDAGYEYRTTNPAAFPMYVPTKEKLPPGVLSPIPSVCVRFVKGADNMAEGQGNIGVQLCFSAWNPGLHKQDIVDGPPADADFKRSSDGWRDAWNMVDVALREIESVTEINGLLIDRSTPVEFGPMTEQESIPDFYPFWFAWVTFTVNYPIIRSIRGIENLL